MSPWTADNVFAHGLFLGFLVPAGLKRDNQAKVTTRNVVFSPRTPGSEPVPGDADITQLLVDAREGDGRAMDQLLPLVYDRLRALAQELMQQERPGHTLQATALVHEAYLKLVDQKRAQSQDRAHFFAVAAQAIRRILVDYARGHGRAKRAGGRARLTLNEELAATYDEVVDVVALDEALAQLAESYPQHARITEMRFFAGLTIEESAAVLGVSTRTVDRHWRYARAWLYRALSGDDRHSPPEAEQDA